MRVNPSSLCSFSLLPMSVVMALAILGGSSTSRATLSPASDPDGSSDDDGTPTRVVAMSHGAGIACAVTESGHVKCWGLNDAGQLGYGHLDAIGDDEIPADVGFVPLDGSAVSVSTNGEQSFALMTDGTVRAWGLNDAYQLGLRHAHSIGDDETPQSSEWSTVPVIGGPVVELSAQGYFACARLEGGAVRCWGLNDGGELGYGHTEAIGDDEDPVDAGDVPLAGVAVQLVTGAHHACARIDDGTVQCWGRNDVGQLGLGHVESIGDDETPAVAGRVDLGGQTAVELVAGGDHTCARLVDGGVRCWGDNSHGQLGLEGPDAVGDDETPALFAPLPLGGLATSLLAGSAHTCAMLQDGALRCWGANDFGQLGGGERRAFVALSDSGVVAVGASEPEQLFSGATGDKTCALFNDDYLHCWGANDGGQLGIGEPDEEVSDSADQFVVVVDETIE